MNADDRIKVKEEKYLNKKFGLLTIKSIYRKGQEQVWCQCECECGSIKHALLNNVVHGYTKSCGCLSKMKKMNNMIGKRYTHLTVEKLYGTDKWGSNVWKCRCDCGGSIIASTGDLNRGFKKDCGCKYDLKKSMLNHEFGYLTPIAYIEESAKEKWLCRCRCGNICIVAGANLKNQHTRSCGCLATKKKKERLIDLTGQKFGWLEVIGRSDRKQHGQIMWQCKCQCGNIVAVLGSNLKSGKIKSCGCLQRIVGRENFEKNFIFKGGTFVNGVLSKKIPKNNTTGIKGVTYNKKSRMYVAVIRFRGKVSYLGSRSTLAEAAELRRRAEEERDRYVREIIMKE